jgi:pimeloyl-ACP methyl ester carboxylesterase
MGQVDVMAADPLFSHAPRLVALLRHLVSAELNGDVNALGQMSIALDVLGRRADFDPSADSVVRVEAGRLRARLREYNTGTPPAGRPTISLPKGSYRPHIDLGSGAWTAETNRAVQVIRFLKTSDDVSIAYSTLGSGPPLVKAANWLSHLEYDFENPLWRHWWQRLGQRYELIRYDERGCGLSDWDVSEFGLDAWVRDLEAVADKITHERFALLGISQGAAVAARYTLLHPERVSRLVLYGGFARGALRQTCTAAQRRELEMLLELVAMSWGKPDSMFRRVFASMFMPDGTPQEHDDFEALQRFSTSPANAGRFMQAFYELDVAADLARIRTPTLVMHARGDCEVPFSEGELFARSIPDARLVPLDGQRHILSEREPAWQAFVREIDRFLAEPGPAA